MEKELLIKMFGKETFNFINFLKKFINLVKDYLFLSE